MEREIEKERNNIQKVNWNSRVPAVIRAYKLNGLDPIQQKQSV